MRDTIKIQVKATVAVSSENGERQYRVFPEGYAWLLTNNEICLDDAYPITMELPYISQEELVTKAIETLQAKQNKIMADAQKQHTDLQHRINQLLCITHQQ